MTRETLAGLLALVTLVLFVGSLVTRDKDRKGNLALFGTLCLFTVLILGEHWMELWFFTALFFAVAFFKTAMLWRREAIAHAEAKRTIRDLERELRMR